MLKLHEALQQYVHVVVSTDLPSQCLLVLRAHRARIIVASRRGLGAQRAGRLTCAQRGGPIAAEASRIHGGLFLSQDRPFES